MGNALNDTVLFTRISEGDEEAFRQLYQRYHQLLYSFLFQLTKSFDSAGDLVQETMLRIWLYREQLAEVKEPKAYIYRIAANRAHTWLKKKMLQASIKQQIADTAQQSSNDTSDTLTIRAIARVVQQAVSKLPEQRRIIYLLNREQGMKAAEIAGRLEISVSTVKNTLLQAVKYIREQVEKAGYSFPVIILMAFSELIKAFPTRNLH